VPVVILSHKRAGKVSTVRFVANTKICVPESQRADYEQYHDAKDIITHPDSVRGLVAKKQWLIENVQELFMMDDDCIGMYRIYRPMGYTRKAMPTRDKAYDIIQNTADTAREIGAFMFGFGSHANPRSYNEFRPLRFGGYTPSGAAGFLKGSKLWWPKDTTLPMCDYWACLLNAYYHRYAYYDKRFAFGFGETFVGSGGLAEFRGSDGETQATRYLIKYFGNDVVVPKNTEGLRAYVTKRTMSRSARTIKIPWRV